MIWVAILVPRRLGWTRRGRGRGQGSGGARPRSGRRALTANPFGARLDLSGPVRGFPLWNGGSRRRGSHHRQVAPGLGGASWCCSVIPSGSPTHAGGASGRMMGCAKRGGFDGRSGSTSWGDHAAEDRGGHDLHGLAAGRRSLRSHAAAPTLGWRRGLPGG